MNLKWIAYSCMLLDHFAAVFLPSSGTAYFFLRMLGRLAFPLFVFMTVRGFCLSSQVRAYQKRLFWLALLSQPVFVLTFGLHRLNVLFELCGILLFLSGFRSRSFRRLLWFLAGVLLCSQSEYQMRGLLLGAAFYLLREKPGIRFPVCFLLAAGLNHGWYCISAFAVPLIAVWEHSGWIRIRSSRLCYLIYPVHLILLAALQRFR